MVRGTEGPPACRFRGEEHGSSGKPNQGGGMNRISEWVVPAVLAAAPLGAHAQSRALPTAPGESTAAQLSLASAFARTNAAALMPIQATITPGIGDLSPGFG